MNYSILDLLNPLHLITVIVIILQLILRVRILDYNTLPLIIYYKS